MDLERIESLLQLLEAHDVSAFTYKDKQQTIKLHLGPQVTTMVAPMAAAPAPAAGQVSASAPANDGAQVVESPMVGTFYRAPSPGAANFVEIGSTVAPGQTLCIVEAMKLMNEIEAEIGGVISEILIENAQPVQFGQPMFKIKPA